MFHVKHFIYIMFHVKHCNDFSNNTRFKTISYSNKHYFFYKIIECIG